MLPDSYFAKTLADARAHLADVQNLIALLERMAGNAAAPTRARRGRKPAAPARTRRTRSDKGSTRRIIRDEVPLATRVTTALGAHAAGLTVPDLTATIQAAGWRTSSADPAQMVRVALAKLMADKIAIVDKTSDPVVYRLRSQIARGRKRATTSASSEEKAA